MLPGELASGEQQMFAIGRAPMNNSEFLILKKQNAKPTLKIRQHAYVPKHGSVAMQRPSAEPTDHPT